ncbi:UDP-N-acetylmuramoyl-L-alanine--D-glutamate ligase [Bacteriovorax sp. PP10]|uniref:UDP-N-acetylmuramoylalanine--D-glutamate ligase n=1 Tax=Bacteriovorax antarcticus TaxID=3088717 RepID=A0ABU5VY60_9BACT|nr:UDP-N-acetylmuramoyl-L-alanine--D-glutamate ligase [Bacteriovorax sp. PP10]MEA9357946.1 UDP-N-acetylmuramoyl-L-alanine--D-glutamate ligase [Bacteriovorax sp. PP10]
MFNLKNKRIAVYGMGVSGLSALRFIKALEGEIIAINGGELSTWAKSPGVLDFVSADQCFSENDASLPAKLNSVDIVILSPGIPRDHKLLKPLLEKNIPIWGEIELAYRYLEANNSLGPLIGITGTNGKTTTTTFLGEMIEGDNKSVFVGGNIGVPFCDYAFDIYSKKKKADFILLELSSFQLESIDHFHVNIAIILNLYQNHGERYEHIEDYGRSKFFITNKFTKDDVLIYPEDFAIIKNWAETQTGKKIAINTTKPEISMDTNSFKLPGIHNLVNLAFIIKAAETIGLTKEAIQKSINTFKGVHHRIEYVDGVKGLPKFKAFNDAKSTNWDATITAVKAMEDFKLPIHLIIGGKKRGHGDSILPHMDFLKTHVDTFYLIGEMAAEIEGEIKGLVQYKNTGTLEETLKIMRAKFGNAEGVLLFSPGFPSFDQFQNYAQRGEHFVKLLTT